MALGNVGESLPRRLRFGPFEVDTRSGELRKHGTRLRLHQQPFCVLLMLVRQPGEVVLREEIRQALWPGDTVVEFDHGINSTIQRLRDALGDSAEKPKYVETLPRRGYRFLAEVEAVDAPAPKTEKPQPPPVEPLPVPPPPATRRGAWIALAGVVLAAGVWFATRSQPAAPPRFDRITHRRGVVQAARFAPDGRSVVYAASWEGKPLDLYNVETGRYQDPRPYGLRATGLLALAPTGQMAVLTNCVLRWNHLVGTLSEMPISGGAPRETLEQVEFADLSPDGEQMAVVIRSTRNNRLEFPRGRVLLKPTGTAWVGHPRLSRDGRFVAIADYPHAGDDGSVAVVDRQGGKKVLTPIYDTLQGLAWAAGGKEIWFTAAEGATGMRQLRAVNPTSGVLRKVAEIPGNLTLHDIVPDGRVLFSKEDRKARVYYLGPEDRSPRDLTVLDWAISPVFAGDGQRLIITENDQSTGGKGLSLLRGVDGSPPVRLGEGQAVSISPDERWVAAVQLTQLRSISLLPMKAESPRTVQIDGELELFRERRPVTWLPDSRHVVYIAASPGHPVQTFVQDIEAGPAKPVTPEGVAGTTVSPDGATLLVRNEHDVYSLHPLAGGVPKPLPSVTSELVPLAFSADSRFLYVVKRNAEPVTVFRMSIADGRTDIVRQLPSDSTVRVYLPSISITPDGRAVAYTVQHGLSELFVAYGLK